jgi:hypothetical protein
MSKKIGIDVGGVLRSRLGIDDLETYLATPPNTDALAVVQWIVATFGKKNTYIVSRCPEEKEQAILVWLDQHGFMTEALLDPANIFFCRERAEKAPIVQSLGINYFIDDRAEVLAEMKDIVDHRLQLSIAEPADSTTDATILTFNRWVEIQQYISRQ